MNRKIIAVTGLVTGKGEGEPEVMVKMSRRAIRQQIRSRAWRTVTDSRGVTR